MEISNPINEIDPFGLAGSTWDKAPVSAGSSSSIWDTFENWLGGAELVGCGATPNLQVAYIPILPALAFEAFLNAEGCAKKCIGKDNQLHWEIEASFGLTVGLVTGYGVGDKEFDPSGKGSQWRNTNTGRWMKAESDSDDNSLDLESLCPCEEDSVKGSITLTIEAAAGWGVGAKVYGSYKIDLGTHVGGWSWGAGVGRVFGAEASVTAKGEITATHTFYDE